jgi:hypothetical protein
MYINQHVNKKINFQYLLIKNRLEEVDKDNDQSSSLKTIYSMLSSANNVIKILFPRLTQCLNLLFLATQLRIND